MRGNLKDGKDIDYLVAISCRFSILELLKLRQDVSHRCKPFLNSVIQTKNLFCSLVHAGIDIDTHGTIGKTIYTANWKPMILLTTYGMQRRSVGMPLFVTILANATVSQPLVNLKKIEKKTTRAMERAT